MAAGVKLNFCRSGLPGENEAEFVDDLMGIEEVVRGLPAHGKILNERNYYV